ncbi:MAG: PD40 domain-containing protein, partial [Bacteroidia bacterium]|nr:PD40 domain-containing protein [Bacteroidia bacterium]
MKNLFSSLVLVTLLAVSCTQKPAPVQEKPAQINNTLTAEEKAGGVMTPEILWKFRRLGTFSLSPDASSVLYTATDIDVATETRITNIYKVSVADGVTTQLTTAGGNSPQWIKNGKSIAFVNKGTLFTMNPDGSEQKEVSGLSDFEIFSVSPDGDKIYFTRRVK